MNKKMKLHAAVFVEADGAPAMIFGESPKFMGKYLEWSDLHKMVFVVNQECDGTFSVVKDAVLFEGVNFLEGVYSLEEINQLLGHVCYTLVKRQPKPLEKCTTSSKNCFDPLDEAEDSCEE